MKKNFLIIIILSLFLSVAHSKEKTRVTKIYFKRESIYYDTNKNKKNLLLKLDNLITGYYENSKDNEWLLIELINRNGLAIPYFFNVLERKYINTSKLGDYSYISCINSDLNGEYIELVIKNNLQKRKIIYLKDLKSKANSSFESIKKFLTENDTK